MTSDISDHVSQELNGGENMTTQREGMGADIPGLIERLRDGKDGWSGDAVCVSAGIAAIAADELDRLTAEYASLRTVADGLAGALGCFLGDDRFHVAVGGNPIVVDRMLDSAHAAITAHAKGKV